MYKISDAEKLGFNFTDTDNRLFKRMHMHRVLDFDDSISSFLELDPISFETISGIGELTTAQLFNLQRRLRAYCELKLTERPSQPDIVSNELTLADYFECDKLDLREIPIHSEVSSCFSFLRSNRIVEREFLSIWTIDWSQLRLRIKRRKALQRTLALFEESLFSTLLDSSFANAHRIDFSKYVFNERALEDMDWACLRLLHRRNYAYRRPEDVWGIDIEAFREAEGIGENRVRYLISLKRKMFLQFLLKDDAQNDIDSILLHDNWAEPFHNWQFNYGKLSKSEQKSIYKIASVLTGNARTRITVEDVADLDIVSFEKLKNVGKSTCVDLLSVKSKLIKFIGANDFKSPETCRRGSLLFPTENRVYSFQEIETCLLEDTDDFLENLEDSLKHIFVGRCGYCQEKVVLKELRYERGCSKQNIYFIHNKVIARFRKSIRIFPEVLLENLNANHNRRFESQMPLLRKCFDSNILFLEFLAMCCNVEPEYFFSKQNIKHQGCQ